MFETIQSATGNPLLDELMVHIAVYLILLIPLSLIALWLLDHKHPAICIFTTTVLAIATAQVLGLGYYHDPPHLQGYETILENDPENAFPSNHASAIIGFALGVLYTRYARFAAVAVAAALLITTARVYTGLHFPLDIAGGALAGIVGLGLVVLTRPYVDRFADVAIAIEQTLLTHLRTLRP